MHCSQISAVVYKNPSECQVEMLRLTENAIRNELSFDERDIARIRLLALVKGTGGSKCQNGINSNADNNLSKRERIGDGRPESAEAKTAQALGMKGQGGREVKRSKERVKAKIGMTDAEDTPESLREAANKAEKRKALPTNATPKERPEDIVPECLDPPI